MTLTMAGPQCDVCGDFILLDPEMEWFSTKGIAAPLCCHTKCRALVEGVKEWPSLPNGPLRKAFEEAAR